MLTLSVIQKISIWILPLLFAITIHEAAHAYVANYLGDATAKRLGRLTLNPVKHIDLFGTIILPLIIGVLTDFNFTFAWAKPVPISWGNLKHPRRDMALVSLAGPMSNLLMAFFWGVILKIGLIYATSGSPVALFMILAGQAGILINVILGLLNLVPIPPLDGSKVVASMLPVRMVLNYLKIEPYGIIILLLLLFTGALSWLLSPIYIATLSFFQYLFAL